VTAQQHRLLVYIDETIRKTGVCPSYSEMLVHLGLKSKGGILRLVRALAADGYIIYKARRTRNIEVIRPQWDGPGGVTLTNEEWQLARWAIARCRRDLPPTRLESPGLDAILARYP
jgi:SOS-response transcriptional repressor LexA